MPLLIADDGPTFGFKSNFNIITFLNANANTGSELALGKAMYGT